VWCWVKCCCCYRGTWLVLAIRSKQSHCESAIRRYRYAAVELSGWLLVPCRLQFQVRGGWPLFSQLFKTRFAMCPYVGWLFGSGARSRLRLWLCCAGRERPGLDPMRCWGNFGGARGRNGWSGRRGEAESVGLGWSCSGWCVATCAKRPCSGQLDPCQEPKFAPRRHLDCPVLACIRGSGRCRCRCCRRSRSLFIISVYCTQDTCSSCAANCGVGCRAERESAPI